MGGYLTDRLRKKNIRWYCWLPAIAIIINMLPATFVFFGANTKLVLGILVLSYFLSALYLGPSIGITQSLVPAQMRAFASAVLFFVLNIIGLGLGPFVIGALSDYLTPTFGKEALRYAFIVTFFTGTIAAMLFYFASRYYDKDILSD
ncbi:MAG: hypothetical protein AAFY41_09965 [Bacteroidota bacterium]